MRPAELASREHTHKRGSGRTLNHALYARHAALYPHREQAQHAAESLCPPHALHHTHAPQVTRSDGNWTYGKIMDYDASGDTYSVMTRAGAKHFVERDTITDDIVVNPSDGSCAQQ